MTNWRFDYGTGKIRAATYGRGLWERPLYSMVNINDYAVNKQSKISIFPNPGNGIINIDLNDAGIKSGKANVKVFNSEGRIVYNKDAILTEDCCLTADLSKESNGVFHVTIRTEKGSYSGTFVKNE